jgi:hypothetical protein
MYSKEETKEKLVSMKMIGGEDWINIREADRSKIKNYITDKEELSLKEILDMVQITEEDIEKIEDIDLKLINNKITGKTVLIEKEALQKNIFEIYVKNKKGSDFFYIIKTKEVAE